MKKIRFLAIFLVLLMLAMPILTACKDDSGSGESSSEEEETTPKKSPNRTSRIPTIDVTIPPGYVSYEAFNSRALGSFSSTGTIASAAKTGVSYSIVESANFASGEDIARALWIYREAMAETSNRDGFINITPAVAKLADIYAVEFDLMVTEKTTTVFLSGRKAPSGATHFNEFIKYDNASGKLTANGQLVEELEQNKWYTITLMLYENSRYYDVYLDGYKRLGQVDYVNGNYPTRSEQEINVYRIGMGGNATAESEFYVDNVAIYCPKDESNQPMEYNGNLATSYEQIIMPQITLFDASTITSENYQQFLTSIMGEEISNINGYVEAEGAEPVKDHLDLKDAFRIEAVSADGMKHYPLAENWGDPFSKTDEELAELGYEKYLFFDGFDSGLSAPAFLFDPEFMASCGIPVQTGADIKKNEEIFTGSDTALFYDISNYSTLEIEFLMPAETREQSKFYQFIVYLASGNRFPAGQNNGISYFNQALKTNDTRFASGTAVTVSFNIGAMGATREAKLTTITSVEFRFTGWNNSVNGSSTNSPNVRNENFFYSDEHPVAIKSIKLSGSVKVPVEDPAEGMETCTHEKDGVSTMTDEVRVEATCTDFGYSAWKCTECGKTTPKQPGADTPMTEILSRPTGHHYGSADENAADFNEREYVYPTCILGGTASAPCVDCGVKAVLEKYAPLGHNYITKIDTANKRISFSCPVCGDFAESKFSDEMPKATDIKNMLDAAGYKVTAICIPNVDLTPDKSTDDTETYQPDNSNYYNKPTLGTKFNILMRGGKFDVIVEGEGENKNTFTRFYYKAQKHTYAEFVPSSTASDVVVEMSMRLGPQVDGKYADWGNIQLIDRSTAATESSGNYMPAIAAVTADGTITFKTSSFVINLSEEKFTQVSLAFHFGNNTLDVYVDGVMRAKDITIVDDDAVNMAAFCLDEVRFFNCQSGDGSTWIDLGNMFTYDASFPVAFTGVALDGVVSDYSGPVLDYDFNDDYVIDTENVKVNGEASVVDNALVVKGKTSVEFVVDPLKRNSNYVLTIDFKGSANGMKNGTLLTGVKSNYYSETLEEAILTVDADGDILFYNQIIGNTSEDMVIVIEVNEDAKVLNIYVNGENIAKGWYNNAEYCKDEDVPYVIGYIFGCTEDGEYAIDSFKVETGLYED